tara:strand:+ start:5318 stop:5995 length:678 start_codon:yes stop_codon:yes gene_type:complete
MKYRTVKLNELVPSPYNPPQREKKTNVLAKSILTNGLLVPIVIANDMTIVDGHRRFTALKKIAQDSKQKQSEVKIPVIQHNSDSHEVYDNMFIAANQDTMMINGNQYLWRYLKGASIPATHLSRIKWIEKALGKTYARGMFKRILDENKSATTYQFALGIYCRYTGLTPFTKNKTAMRKVAYFLLNVENPFRLKSAIAHFIPVNMLKKCVKNREKFDIKFVKVNK